MKEKTSLLVIRQEWTKMDRYMSQLREERDDALAQLYEARRWCEVMLLIILMLALALGYVLAQGGV